MGASRPHASTSTGSDRFRRSFRTTCRRYTSMLLVVVGIAVGATLALFDVWWGLTGAVLIAFLFGAVIARPWCAAAYERT